jgi:periplasmic protein TonB
VEKRVEPPPPAPPAPPEPPRVAAITNPDWVRKPSGADIERYYPDRAKNLGKEGRAVIRCSVTAQGTLSNCSVVNEDPADFGFGDASIRASVRFKMRPKLSDGRPVEGGVVTIPISWRLQ